MVKHISKIIKETELYKENERRKFEEFLPGVSEVLLSIVYKGIPIGTPKKYKKAVFHRKNTTKNETKKKQIKT